MFDFDDKNETITRMIANARKYGELRIETLERSTAEKMSKFFCALIIGAIVLIIGGIVAVLLSIAAVIALAPHMGGTIQACLFLAFVYTTLLLVVFLCRRMIFRAPLKRAFDRLILADKATVPAPTITEMERTRQAVLHDYNTLREPSVPRNKRDRILGTVKKCWTLAEGGLLGYKLYKQFLKGRGRRF